MHGLVRLRAHVLETCRYFVRLRVHIDVVVHFFHHLRYIRDFLLRGVFQGAEGLA